MRQHAAPRHAPHVTERDSDWIPSAGRPDLTARSHKSAPEWLVTVGSGAAVKRRGVHLRPELSSSGLAHHSWAGPNRPVQYLPDPQRPSRLGSRVDQHLRRIFRHLQTNRHLDAAGHCPHAIDNRSTDPVSSTSWSIWAAT